MHELFGEMTLARSLYTDRRGVTAMEYGLIAALVAVALIGVLGGLGTQLQNTFTSITTALSGATTGGK